MPTERVGVKSSVKKLVEKPARHTTIVDLPKGGTLDLIARRSRRNHMLSDLGTSPHDPDLEAKLAKMGKADLQELHSLTMKKVGNFVGSVGFQRERLPRNGRVFRDIQTPDHILTSDEALALDFTPFGKTAKIDSLVLPSVFLGAVDSLRLVEGLRESMSLPGIVTGLTNDELARFLIRRLGFAANDGLVFPGRWARTASDEELLEIVTKPKDKTSLKDARKVDITVFMGMGGFVSNGMVEDLTVLRDRTYKTLSGKKGPLRKTDVDKTEKEVRRRAIVYNLTGGKRS